MAGTYYTKDPFALQVLQPAARMRVYKRSRRADADCRIHAI